MANERLEAMARTLKLMADEDDKAAEDRRALYLEAMELAQREWEKARAFCDEWADTVAEGFASPEMVEEYLLQRHRMRKMQRLYLDRREAYARTELPGADPVPTRIAVGKGNAPIE